MKEALKRIQKWLSSIGITIDVKVSSGSDLPPPEPGHQHVKILAALRAFDFGARPLVAVRLEDLDTGTIYFAEYEEEHEGSFQDERTDTLLECACIESPAWVLLSVADADVPRKDNEDDDDVRRPIRAKIVAADCYDGDDDDDGGGRRVKDEKEAPRSANSHAGA